MTLIPTNAATAPNEVKHIRPLTAHELGLVSGGPMGFPGLGQQPGPQDGEPRQLTPEELALVAGGPMGYPGLALPPETETNGSPSR